MPIYEFKCKECGNEFEMLQKFSDPDPSECPSCSGKVTKLISNCTFHLKGTGWYATDYGKQGNYTEKKESEKKRSESSTKKSDDTVSCSSNDSKSSEE